MIETIAQRLDGDYLKATQLMLEPHAELDGRSPMEAADTSDGMLRALELFPKKPARRLAIVEFIDAMSEIHRNEISLLLDLLPAAWGMSDDEFENLLAVPQGWLPAWRNHDVEINSHVEERARRLRHFNDALKVMGPPQRIASFWRRGWREESTIGSRSPWEAFIEDGDVALNAIEAALLAQR